MGRTFFGLTSAHKADLHKLLFAIVYGSKGAFSFDDVYKMPVHLRTFYKNQLEQVKEEEKRLLEGSTSSAPPKSKVKRPK